jgi:hypothetical protein
MPIVGASRLVLLALWLGAALFFSAVVAPAAFGVLRSFALPNASEIAGAIVTRSLTIVNVAGFVIGLVLLVTIFLLRSSAGRIAFLVQLISVAVITLATGVGHWVIAARIRALRASLEMPIDQISADNPIRQAFNSLHGYSVNALAIAMIASLIAIVLMARDFRE